MRKLALILAGPVLLLAACSQAPGTSGPTRDGGAASDGFAVGLDSAKGEGAPAAMPAPNAGIPNVVISADRNLILTAKIAMRSTDPWATSDQAQLIATALGGDVLGLSQ